MQISSEFREMLSSVLPSQSEQDKFFEAFQQSLKKSLSIMQHREQLKKEHSDKLKIGSNSNFGKFQLSVTPFSKEFPDTLYVDREDTTIALGKTRQHLTGQFYIQEVAASLPANILKSLFTSEKAFVNKAKGQDHHDSLKILDLCAAPGGKTSQLADFLLSHHIPGIVWGNDVDAKRLSTRANNIQRCGLYNTVATKIDGSQIGNIYPEFFDAILVDAPCSGEGTGFKSDAAYKRRKQESINKIVGLQESIVDSAIRACKPGGLILYSTCTINLFENEMQIEKLLAKYGDILEILPIEVEQKSKGIHLQSNIEGDLLRCRPHIHHTGGFFVCAMRKTQSSLTQGKQKEGSRKSNESLSFSKSSGAKSKAITTPFSYNKQIEKTVVNILSDEYGIKLDTSMYAIIEGKHKLNLTDASARKLVESGVRFQECGIPILKATGKTFSLEHEIAISLGHLATRNTIELNEQEIQDYALGADISLDDQRANLAQQTTPKICNGYFILTHHGLGVGVGKVIDGKIKNKFFKW